MTRQELIDFCLTFAFAYEDYPFAPDKDGTVWTVMRHRVNAKTFALIFEKWGRLCINLKCDPFEAAFLRGIFKDLTAGYHMNKAHWNTILLPGDVPTDALKSMIKASYELIKPKVKHTNGIQN
jgi:predicted DNA-binding protein (MmcQ/YjbR family)